MKKHQGGTVANLENKEAIEKMKELVKHNSVCMFTTLLAEGYQPTRPMATQAVDDAGHFWFFSSSESYKNEEIQHDSRVQLYYANSGDSEFMTVYGRAHVSRNEEKIRELWNPMVKAWFQGGQDDARLTVVEVVPEEAYYWDTKDGKMISMLKIAAAVIAGKTMDGSVEGNLKVK
jgi:general stress protein 26